MRNKKILSLLVTILCIVVLAPSSIYAATDIDVTRAVTMTIEYADGSQGIAGAEFKLYKIADTDEDTSLTLTQEYRGYPIRFRGLDDASWKTLALTVTGYIERDGLTPIAVGKTDANGKLVISQDRLSAELKPGLYLLTGTPAVMGKFRYKAQPAMVFLPASLDDKETWIYDAKVTPKFDKAAIPPKQFDLTAVKAWDDAGYESERPAKITMQLLRDGKVYDEQQLNAKNNWRYTWTGLTDDYSWNVVEKDKLQYSVTTEKNGDTYTVTNKYEPPKRKTPKVPYTGLLWWPVLLCLAAGLIFVIIGTVKRRHAR